MSYNGATPNSLIELDGSIETYVYLGSPNFMKSWYRASQSIINELILPGTTYDFCGEDTVNLIVGLFW